MHISWQYIDDQYILAVEVMIIITTVNAVDYSFSSTTVVQSTNNDTKKRLWGRVTIFLPPGLFPKVTIKSHQQMEVQTLLFIAQVLYIVSVTQPFSLVLKSQFWTCRIGERAPGDSTIYQLGDPE